MGTRRRIDLRGFLKQSQKNTSEEIIDERSSSYLLVEEEEVVKYMSKLPGYLQGDESLQSSVLNVGVLDWSRLEKWKKHGRARGATADNTCERKVSSTLGGTVPNVSHRRCKIDDDDHHHVHTCSNLGKKVKASRDLHQHGLRCTLKHELASSSMDSSLNKQEEMPTCSYSSSSARDQERVKSRRSRSSSALLSTMGNSGGSLGSKGRSFKDKETEKRAGVVQESRERGKPCVDKFDGDSNAGRLTCEKQKEEFSNIVLLRSRKQSRSILLSSAPLMHSSLDDNNANRSLHLERDSEDMMLPLLLGVDLSSKTEPSGSRTTTSHSKAAFDQEKKRDPSSPSKRFSFSFGRLSRSFTFNEEDSSASDSMRRDGLACPSQSSSLEEKHNTHCGSRVSPLRRLLDPLLKPKDPENFLLPSKARSSSFNQDEKKKQDDASRTRALLQLTIRNGIPLFQFVVDDDNLNKGKSRSILGATMKSSSDASSLVKDDDSVQYCTFYSVNEGKKKKSGSWLINKEKPQQQHRFVYNVIGEMRLCNSSTEQKSENITSVIRESVLVDETEEGVKGRKEVAAVVIKKKKKPAEENGETTVIIPGGVHSIPEKGAPTPLIRRWRSGGCCDCGGWDVGCKLHLLSNKTFLHDFDFDQTFKLLHQEESDKNCGPVLAMTELKRGGIYSVEFGSFLSPLQAFFVCVTVITCASEDKTVSKTSGKSSSPFPPPLSPVGRA